MGEDQHMIKISIEAEIGKSHRIAGLNVAALEHLGYTVIEWSQEHPIPGDSGRSRTYVRALPGASNLGDKDGA